MAAPTNAAFVKKVLANSEPSTHEPKADIGNAFAETPNQTAFPMCLKPLAPAIVQRHDARFEPCRGHELQEQ
jgi:hypothetical protein